MTTTSASAATKAGTRANPYPPATTPLPPITRWSTLAWLPGTGRSCHTAQRRPASREKLS